jgi:hypothetical protein
MAKQETAIHTTRGLPAGVKVAIVVLAMGAAALFGGCENETTPKVCECPNGTVHNNFGCECGGEGCVCTHTLYHLNYGMVLDNQTGASLPDDFVGGINTLLEILRADPIEDAIMNEIIDNHHIKIIIVPDTAFSRNGDELTVGMDVDYKVK